MRAAVERLCRRKRLVLAVAAIGIPRVCGAAALGSTAALHDRVAPLRAGVAWLDLGKKVNFSLRDAVWNVFGTRADRQRGDEFVTLETQMAAARRRAGLCEVRVQV